MYYYHRGRGTALISLILSVLSLFLPWFTVTISFAGLGTLGEVSLYHILSNLGSFRATFVKSDFMLLTFYGSILMFMLAIIAGIICVARWRKFKRKSWVPGLFALLSFFLWYTLLQEISKPVTGFAGAIPGYGSWALLLSGILWIWANF